MMRDFRWMVWLKCLERHLKVVNMTFYCLFIILCTYNSSSAQTPDLQIDGTVKGDGKRLSGTTVELFQDGVSFDRITTAINGKFYFELPLDHNYLLVYSKKGYVSKRISINTGGIPEKIAKSGFAYGGWEVDLFSEVEGLDVSILDKPIGKILFNPSEGNFDYDKEYTKSIQDELNRMQKELLRLDNEYNALLQKGDDAIKAGQYENAIGFYEDALKIKPNQDYPEKQIQNAKKLIEEQKIKDAELLSREKQYNATIELADKSFNEEQYIEAKEKYKVASTILPDKQYPKDKITQIDKILAEIASKEAESKLLEEKYKKLILNADNAMSVKQYSGALSNYNAASKLKPNEQYPKDKIAEINKILVEIKKAKESEAKYNDAVSRGNSAYASSEFETAKAAFIEALEIKPDEPYPKKRLEEIEQKIKELLNQQELDEKYSDAINKGNRLFDNLEYSEAKIAFEEALVLKPDKPYPKTKIAEIDRLIKEESNSKLRDAKYMEQIKLADELFNAEKYEEALDKYKIASNLKNTEQYPKQKIEEINKILDEISKKQSVESRYTSLITSADNNFNSKNYQKAKGYYQDALEIKPEETYPSKKIKEIDEILATISANDALEKQYQELITSADNQYHSKKYSEAKTNYMAALELKPGGEYPKKQIVIIDKQLKKIQDGLEAEKKYADLLISADEKFNNRKFKEAKAIYKTASSYKPLETYPREQIRKIDIILSKLEAKNLNENDNPTAIYKKAISEADYYFKTKNYNNARIKYSQALSIKASEPYPQSQISRIDKILAETAGENDKEYEKLITGADELFKTLQYEKAQKLYKAASDRKPYAEYPKRKLVEISTALKDMIAQAKAEEERKRRLALLEEQRKRNQEIANKVNENNNKNEEISQEEEEFMTELAQKYPPGITEISEKDESQTILKRIVVIGGQGNEYKRVIHSWGGRFYFKNGHPITQLVWDKETSPDQFK